MDEKGSPWRRLVIEVNEKFIAAAKSCALSPAYLAMLLCEDFGSNPSDRINIISDAPVNLVYLDDSNETDSPDVTAVLPD